MQFQTCFNRRFRARTCKFCSWFDNVVSTSRLFESHVAGKMRQIAWKAGLQMREDGATKYMACRVDNKK